MIQVISPERIDVNKVVGWKDATKVQGLFAKPVSTIVTDVSLISKLTIRTLEGDQDLDGTKMLCTGLNKTDPWQMDKAELFDKYKVEGITEDGWLSCVPIPGNIVRAIKVKAHFFQVEALSGTKIHPNGDPKEFIYIQSGITGDYILQDKENPKKVWIVNEAIFDQTYKFITPDATSDAV